MASNVPTRSKSQKVFRSVADVEREYFPRHFKERTQQEADPVAIGSNLADDALAHVRAGLARPKRTSRSTA